MASEFQRKEALIRALAHQYIERGIEKTGLAARRRAEKEAARRMAGPKPKEEPPRDKPIKITQYLTTAEEERLWEGREKERPIT